MELVVLLVFCGLSAGTVAKIKGSSFVLWFLVGGCLPVLGTLAALASRDERGTPLRECDECGNVVPITNQVCNRCGADLDYAEPELGEEPELAGQERLF